ncbi:MAG: 5'/3'-nucleotidase SurE [Actinobacteria bacterium]|nr:5'/3'-nucleotidase SurE [Actinomycetota bacterium]
MDKKFILLTNDDGINAQGLYHLYRSLKDTGKYDVCIVAPDKESSAVGHAITVFRPISVTREYRDGEFFGYALDGTPADCVKLAVRAILEKPPDLLISGINQGPNMGENIIYSGTVSAATEGTMCGISSMAVSIDNMIDPDFGYASKFMAGIAARVLENGGFPTGTLLNINIPDMPEGGIKGARITIQGDVKFREFFIKRRDPRGRDYYWMDGELIEQAADEEFDYIAVKNGFVSITPIHYDMTDYKAIDYLKKWDLKNLMK